MIVFFSFILVFIIDSLILSQLFIILLSTNKPLLYNNLILCILGINILFIVSINFYNLQHMATAKKGFSVLTQQELN